jgi:phosphohistidine phosphatase
MKQLYLVRHAKAIQEQVGLADFDRPLTEKGAMDAHLISSLLHKQKVQPQLILSSPAVRALSTAIIFARNLHYPHSTIQIKEDLYEASVDTYIKNIQQLKNNSDTLFVFAHNPTITETANLFIDDFIEHIPTSGVTGISFSIDSWAKLDKNTKGTLALFDFPKNHKPVQG